jgi:hypothetical protein
VCYMSCPSHPPLLDHSNYKWRRIRHEAPNYATLSILLLFHCKFKHQMKLGILHFLFFWGCEVKTTLFPYPGHLVNQLVC